jgi:hypothetical protein
VTIAIPRTALSERMHALADTGHQRAAELREKARAFDEATAGVQADPRTCSMPKFLGCFARARRLWCDITGEPLV